MTRGFRVPREVIAYASRLLPQIAPLLAPATSVRESAGDLSVRAVSAEELTAAVVAACRESLGREGSIGLIAADDRIPRSPPPSPPPACPYLAPGEETSDAARLTLVPATLAKGLEYDYVVLDEPAAIIRSEPDPRTGLRRLYVCLTRAVSGLTVLHAEDLPAALT